MITESQLLEFFSARGGCDRGEHCNTDGTCCVLEAIGLIAHPSYITDEPADPSIRSFDLRPLNDAAWSSPYLRAEWMAKLGAAYAGSLQQCRDAATVSEAAAVVAVRAAEAAASVSEGAVAADSVLIAACEIWLEAARFSETP